MVSDFGRDEFGQYIRGLNPCSNGIWSLTRLSRIFYWDIQVLILVLMEYGLWQYRLHVEGQYCRVLILVLMEYGLWPVEGPTASTAAFIVLILVLMEYGLWLMSDAKTRFIDPSLNPCSNGIWSLTVHGGMPEDNRQIRLNPCSNGIWSLTKITPPCSKLNTGLNPCSNGIWSLTLYQISYQYWVNDVLILVLMEYGLWLTYLILT